MKKFEHVYTTNEMPDHRPTTNKIWLGLLSGCLISIVIVPLGIIGVIQIADSIDAISQFWIAFICIGSVALFLAYPRIKKMIKP